MNSNPKLGLIARISTRGCGWKSLQHLQLYVLFTLLFAPTVFAQCDPNSAGGFTDTAYDSGADGSSTGGVDNNGGWNEDAPYPYIEAGQKIIGDSFRVKGIVGTYDGSGAGNGDTSKDLDWIHFSVAQDCSLTVTLSMADKNGIALNGTDLFDLLFIQQGSDPSTSIDLYGSYGVDGCPHYALNELPNGDQQSQFPVNAGDILLIVTTPMDGFAGSPPLAYHGPMSYGLDVAIGPAVSNDDCINPWAGAPNDCVFNAQLVTQFPASIAFDCTQADTDGPNDSANLCGSNTSHDVWYEVGPVPADGDLLISMCGQGNHGDAVLSVYKIPEFRELWTRENQVQMQCFRGQVVEFKPQTRVLLEQLLRQGEQTRDELRLLIGQLTAKITRVLSDLDAFVVHTPAAHIFTKGAEYSVQVVSPKQTYCEVSQGAMTVISGTSQIQVNAGQALNVELGEPLRPLKLEALQRGYIYLAQQNDQLDKLALRFNCNLNLLRLANPHVSSGGQLCPGTMLLIPQAISEYSQ